MPGSTEITERLNSSQYMPSLPQPLGSLVVGGEDDDDLPFPKKGLKTKYLSSSLTLPPLEPYPLRKLRVGYLGPLSSTTPSSYKQNNLYLLKVTLTS